MKSGVIDPTKVTRSALQHAASISALMLTTEAMICEIPEKKSSLPLALAATALRWIINPQKCNALGPLRSNPWRAFSLCYCLA